MMLLITPGERRALDLLAHEGSDEQVAACLGVGTCDVDSRLKALFSRMDVSNSAEAMAVAVRRGLVEISLDRRHPSTQTKVRGRRARDVCRRCGPGQQSWSAPRHHQH